MKKQRRLLSMLLVLLIAFPTMPIPAFYGNTINEATAEAAVKKAKITNVATGTLTIEKGESFKLQANRSDLKWKSSDKKIVTVSKAGKIKGIKDGKATVTASAKNTKASVEVTVGTKVSSVNVIKPAMALVVGAQSTIKAEISPADASNQTIAYESSDKGVVSVSEKGVVTAKKTGTAQITVSSTDNTKKKETVMVTVRASESPVRLQDDFYQAINATVLNEHALQENQYEWSGFNDVQNRITTDLSSIIDKLVENKDKYKDDSIEKKIINFYTIDRDMDKRNAAGVEPLKPYTDQIDNAKTVAEFIDVLAEFGKAGQGSVFTFQVTSDLMDSNKYVLVNNGPTYILPKDYMTGDVNKPIQQAVLAFMKQMFVLAGESEDKASEIAEQVFNLEQDLASSGLGLEDRYDIEKMYHPYTKAQLKELYSNCDIEGYLKEIGITNFENCIVYEEDNAKKINGYLTQDNLELLKNYTKFTLYMGFSNYLTDAHYKALQEINYIISGVTDDKDYDQIAKETTQSLFSWEFGKLYVENYFSEESKKEIEEMTHEILNTFRNRIQRIDWLSETTKQRALKKLDTMKVKIGYPDKWPSYFDEINIDISKNLIENLMDIMKALNSDIQKTLDMGTVDKNEWIMQPQVVNACYNPQANDITFPAAILQKPFYDKDASYAQNLGGIGTVIGHEITHAFDTSGAEYDENGNYNNWWTPEDMQQFTARAQKVKDYYNGMEITNGVFQNGDMTITENIADMGAMACALEIAGDDKKAQLEIFKSNATIWASNQTDQYRDYLLTADVHSQNKIRVNAILPLFEQFYDIFGITKNDAMYVAPEDRVHIW